MPESPWQVCAILETVIAARTNNRWRAQSMSWSVEMRACLV